jgi:hypothetical protein
MKIRLMARKLGLDGNPLRRPSDRIAVWLAALLLAVFLIGAPFLSAAAVGWVGHRGGAGLPAARSLHQVSAYLAPRAPTPTATGGILRYYQVMARWTAPDGRTRTGWIPVRANVAAGRMVRLWVNSAGSPSGTARNRGAMVADEVGAAVIASSGLGVAVLCLAWAGRFVLNRRRLAGWQAGWAAVGPQWTRRFRSRG